jgi:TonB family protein
MRVAPDSASALLVQKAPPKYPDAAVKAGIQGEVVLKVVTSYSGDVEEVTVVSGDPALSQAAADVVKQWKYKPYQVEGSPTEMETHVTINFKLKSHPQPAALPLGTFSHNAYPNDYFGILYPLSRDWVRETDLMRSKLASEGASTGTYVLLAAIHIPQDSDPLRADSSFTVLAVTRAAASSQDCKQYLELVANSAESQKAGKQKGEMTQFTIAGHDFYRSDLEYRHGVDHRTFLCTAIKDSLVQWNIVGWSKQAIETAVSTLNSMTPLPSTAQPGPRLAPGDDPNAPKRVPVMMGVSAGLLVKKVVPVYPPEARNNRIEGSVVMKALINKTAILKTWKSSRVRWNSCHPL